MSIVMPVTIELIMLITMTIVTDQHDSTSGGGLASLVREGAGNDATDDASHVEDGRQYRRLFSVHLKFYSTFQWNVGHRTLSMICI